MHHQKLKCYSLLLEFARKVPELLNMLPRGNAYWEDQLKRAVASSIQNLAEGNGRTSVKERRHFFDISLASIAEVAAIIDIMVAYGYIPAMVEIECKALLRRSYQMLVKLKNAHLNFCPKSPTS